MKQSNKNIESLTKIITDARLMIAGPMEDERIFANKIKADNQINSPSKENLNVPDADKKDRSISNLRNFKHPYPVI
jgi:hypothetical protein